MILKASQRGGGSDLAAHLMRADENEHVQLHELRGFASGNLKDAFKESEAICRAPSAGSISFRSASTRPIRRTCPRRISRRQ